MDVMVGETPTSFDVTVEAVDTPASGDFGPDEGDDIAPVEDSDNGGLLGEDGFEYDPSHEVIEVTTTPQNLSGAIPLPFEHDRRLEAIWPAGR